MSVLSAWFDLSEDTLLVGKRGEIYTDAKLREQTGIKKGGRVKATVADGRLIIEPLLSIEDLLKKPPLITISVEQAERISERAQKEQGIFG